MPENKPTLSYGLYQFPPDVKTVWGARWIFPDDQVYNRQDFWNMDTEDGQRLKNWLDKKGIRAAMEGARKMSKKGIITEQSEETVILYEDDTGIIKGNPQRSYGYLYVCGFLK